MADGIERPKWWQTPAGILTLAAGCMTAFAGLVAAVALLFWVVRARTPPAPVAPGGAPAPPGGAAPASGTASLAGTWKGSLDCDGGEKAPATIRFSGSGYPIYEYQTRSGGREVELTAAGQSLRFVPPDGGVATVTVDSLSAAPGRVTYAMSLSEERTSQDTLTQARMALTFEAALSGAGLSVRMNMRGQTTISQPGTVVPGEAQTAACSGTLRRE